MSDVLHPLIDEFEKIATEAQTLSFLPRDTTLQAAATEHIDQFLQLLGETKGLAVSEGNEEAANTILSMELALDTVRHQLQMWVALKRDAPESAWDHLVDAQQSCDAAISVRRQLPSKPQVTGLENLSGVLNLIEQVVFPPQVFCSFGATVHSRTCSICGREYDDCGHIRGRAYMGKLCYTILRELDVREVSIVPHPANKRARVTHFSDGTKMRNRMTWRLEDRGSEHS